jgi:hypothetical protein
VVRLLLDAGANVNEMEEEGEWTALDWRTLKHNSNAPDTIANLLIAAGGLNSRNLNALPRLTRDILSQAPHNKQLIAQKTKLDNKIQEEREQAQKWLDKRKGGKGGGGGGNGGSKRRRKKRKKTRRKTRRKKKRQKKRKTRHKR